MVTDEKLMRALMRTTARARRLPRSGDRQKGPPFGKGFGHILDRLTDHDGISQQQLADDLGIRPQSVSEAIAAMENHGLIRREPSTEDRRVMRIYITPQGKEHHKWVIRQRRIHAKAFFSGLTASEKETLYATLEKLGREFDENKETEEM